MAKTRLTNQRLKILEYLKSVKTHPTAEEVYRDIRTDLPAISLATVYRNLHFLADQGLILKLEINNELHFDGDTCDHQHCVCKKCGRIIDVFQADISKYALEKITLKEFEPLCVCIIFHGICKKCLEENKNGK